MKKCYKAPEETVNDYLEQLEKDIIRIRTVFICLFAAFFSIGILLLF